MSPDELAPVQCGEASEGHPDLIDHAARRTSYGASGLLSAADGQQAGYT